VADYKIMLVAGEPSGDILGGRLMAGLRELAGGRVAFCGVGGPRMAEQGLESLFPYTDLTVMGLAEVLPRLFRIMGRIAETAELARVSGADAVVTIDAPDFSFRVAARLRGLGIPLLHYVAPTVWAWRPGRAAKIAKLYDHLLALLPFEPPYFHRAGLACSFVGHPVIEGGAARGHAGSFRKRHRIDDNRTLLAVLPGSRKSEVTRLAGPFGEALGLLAASMPNLQAVVPTVPNVADFVRQAASTWPVPATIIEGDDDKYGAFAASRAAIAASGTVALELALAGLPHVVAYRVNPLTAFVVRRLVTVRFANLVNLVLDRPVVPELIQDDCRPQRLAEEVGRLMLDETTRAVQRKGFAEALESLGAGDELPSRRAARVVLDIAEKGRARRLS
jgi:lipid-A-disaccharide synthase